MSDANSSLSSGAEGFRCAPSRRSILSTIPAALFAGWRAVRGRSRTDSGVPDAPWHMAWTELDQPAQTYVYTYGSDAAEGRWCSDDEAAMPVVIVYDEQGRLLYCDTPSRNIMITSCSYDAAWD